MELEKLKDPFAAEDIEWRVGQAGANNGKPWAKVLAYLTSRAIMDRLDAVVGPERWCNKFYPGPVGGVMCGIAIRIGEEWVWKYDGADNPKEMSDGGNPMAVKGGYSNALKRAAVQWGIGRYLYDLPGDWANIHGNGANYAGANKKKNIPAFKWDAPTIPAWALPGGSGKPDATARQTQPAARQAPPADTGLPPRDGPAGGSPRNVGISEPMVKAIYGKGHAVYKQPGEFDSYKEWLKGEYGVAHLEELTKVQGKKILDNLDELQKGAQS